MSNNPESTVTNQPFFETVFTKHKKIFYALPVIVVALIVGLYYTSASASSERNPTNSENDIDVSLPDSETKELSDDKLGVMNDFSELSEEKEDAKVKSDNANIEDVDLNTTDTYQNENDAKVVSKVNKMLLEMENEKRRPRNTASYSSPQAVAVRTTPVKNEVDYEEKNNTEESFNNFFSNKSNNTTASGQTAPQQQNTPFIYASIKGDHLRLRNNSRVTLILSKDALIKGKLIKRNTLVYAQATFYGNRVNLTINNINQIPITIKAYDAEDGNLGMQVQESLIAETGSEVVSDGADEVDVSGVPLGNTIKSLFKKKQQEPKIDLLNNQRLILKVSQ